MKRVLEDELVAQLKVRVKISRSVRVISQRGIAKGFTMSVATLRRYNNTEERKLSRSWAAQAYQKEKKTRSNVCECGTAFKEHDRCKRCSILIHTDPEPCKTCHVFHGKSTDGKRCDSCRLNPYRTIEFNEYNASNEGLDPSVLIDF